MNSRILWLVAVVATLSLSGCVAYAQPAQLAAMPEGALVDGAWLEANLNHPNIRVIEVSTVPGVYEGGHVPGAVNIVWHTDLVDTVRRDIVPADRFQEMIRRAGIHADTQIVIYGDNNNWFAGWGAWVFHLYGFDQVRLLDGGRMKWEADGRLLSAEVPSYAPGSAVVGDIRHDLRAGLADVLAIVEGTTPAMLLDIRSAAEYSGELFAPEGVPELSIRAGHIPGALNIPWRQNVNEDGTFKSIDELRTLYNGFGVDGSQRIITYCRIGERAALTWFVLHRLLGYETALYDGSWTEYGNTVAVPIENPAGTIWGKR